jgi:protein farnesyltransferase subunit beta
MKFIHSRVIKRMYENYRTIATFKNWQLPTGGFGGGSDQLAHLATTYAAVNALAIAGTKEAYDVLDRY